jgi:UDP-glucose 4-epimerase
MTPAAIKSKIKKTGATARKAATAASRKRAVRKIVPAKRNVAIPIAPKKHGLRIFITGMSGYFAQVLIPLLLKDPNVEAIVGIDKHPISKIVDKRIQFYALDMRDPEVKSLMKSCDVLVHLGFVLWRRPGQPNDRDINVSGSYNIIDAAVASGIRKIIFTSSAVAYGLYNGNPALLTEESALRPNQDISYGWAQGEIERYLDRVEKENPGLLVTRLRPSAVVGPRLERDRLAALVENAGVLISGHDPQIQLTHEEDLAKALLLAIYKNLPGIYNVASDGPMTLSELYALRKVNIRAVPYWIGRLLTGIAWQTGQSILAPEWIKFSLYPIVVSNQKIKHAGWKPKYTTQATWQAVLEPTRTKVK